MLHRRFHFDRHTLDVVVQFLRMGKREHWKGAVGLSYARCVAMNLGEEAMDSNELIMQTDVVCKLKRNCSPCLRITCLGLSRVGWIRTRLCLIKK